MTTSLDIAGLTIDRGGRRVLTDINVTIQTGGLTAVVGPNGAGKSSLLAAIAGTLAFEGSVTRNGAAIPREHIGYMPQTVGVGSGLTALETVLLGRLERLGHGVKDVDLMAAIDGLQRFGMGMLAQRPMHSLSGGQQQLTLLAQRLVREPRLLLLDEPTSALDIRHQLIALDCLKSYAREKNAIVLAALHDLNLAARFCERLLFIKDGHCLSDGEPQTVFERGIFEHAYRIKAEVFQTADGRPAMIPIAAIPL